MAERIVSPGVFTNEVDQSFLAGGVAQIGAAVIGPTVKGPALIPTQITSMGDFEKTFGTFTDDSYVPFVVNDYLRNGNVITVTRLLYEDGYNIQNGALAIVASSGSSGVSAFSTGSSTLIGASVDNQEFRITQGANIFRFVASGDPIPSDNPAGNLFFFSTGSNAAGTVTNLANEINGVTSLQSVVSASFDSATLILSGSSIGSSANGITFASSSATDATVFSTQFTMGGGSTTSAAASYITHILHPTQAVLGAGSVVDADYFEDSVLNNDASGSFEIKLSGSFATDTNVPGFSSFLVAEGVSISSSINQTNNSYLTKTFGRSPKSLDYPVYVQYENKTALSTLFNNIGDVTISLEKYANYDFKKDFSVAATPYITSQKIGSITKNLFRFHTLSHGDSVNSEVKIGIRDIKLASEVSDPNGYGTFTVEVRRVNTSDIPNSPYASEDTDQTPDIIETFQNVNLDPNSPKYISRVIGDRFQTVTNENDVKVNGDYPNMSQFIRVSVEPGVADGSNDKSYVPFGFKALTSPVANATASVNLEAVSYKTSQVDKGYNSNIYFGFDYTDTHNLNYLAVTPKTDGTVGSNTDFYLGDMIQDSGSAFPSLVLTYSGSLQDALNADTFTTNVAPSTRKFIVPFQDGFDGARPNLPKFNGENITSANTFGFDCSTSTSTGTKSYNKAFSVLSNTDYYDMNLLVTPGIIDSLHSTVTNAARNLVKERQDTFYVMDSNPVSDNIATVVSQVTALDNNYVASYWPWVRIINPNKGVPLFVPPSVVLPGVLAFNDAVQHPWYAPAGLNRGVVNATDTYIRLTQSQRDTLYEARVNPIANFVNDGICIWGQKTLQARPSALDRVNVRRLLIAVKKFIASSTRFLVFEQNTTQTRDRFLSIVNPYLAQVKANQGLYAFRAVMDGTNNTPDMIDQNILYGQLFLQPTRTAEFIVLDFNIQPTGASFPE